jgi:crossover junction endodeoxyribonuclease RuvC
MIILGIDPGFQYAGFSILKKEGQRVFLIEAGFLKMSSTEPLHHRVAKFHDFFHAKILAHTVTDLALETPFLGKNAQNFLKLGYLRGILYLLASQHSLALHEFSPTQVKLAVTGSGGASKEQVAYVVLKLFPRLEQPKKADVTDSLAVSLCGIWQNKNLTAR